mmetsp:Transcript_5917/g.14032  ORF Transcript_5917/g.14032 Transcript_5917/m.14032 type:complete len:342 (+) Transcript_5917:785-1810(+)
MWSLEPSQMALKAQQASTSASASSDTFTRSARGSKTGSNSGRGGVGLPRQALRLAQTRLRKKLGRPWAPCSIAAIGVSAPAPNTTSRAGTESPAMLPSAQTTCSWMSSLGERSFSTKIGTTSRSSSSCTFSVVPAAMFVRAHAVSNCNSRQSPPFRSSMRRGTMPEPTTWSMFSPASSTLSTLRRILAAETCVSSSSDISMRLMAGTCSSEGFAGSYSGSDCSNICSSRGCRPAQISLSVLASSSNVGPSSKRTSSEWRWSALATSGLRPATVRPCKSASCSVSTAFPATLRMSNASTGSGTSRASCGTSTSAVSIAAPSSAADAQQAPMARCALHTTSAG